MTDRFQTAFGSNCEWVQRHPRTLPEARAQAFEVKQRRAKGPRPGGLRQVGAPASAGTSVGSQSDLSATRRRGDLHPEPAIDPVQREASGRSPSRGPLEMTDVTRAACTGR
jgi:hypothetical protein